MTIKEYAKGLSHCFLPDQHAPHIWGPRYYCGGEALGPDMKPVPIEQEKTEESWVGKCVIPTAVINTADFSPLTVTSENSRSFLCQEDGMIRQKKYYKLLEVTDVPNPYVVQMPKEDAERWPKREQPAKDEIDTLLDGRASTYGDVVDNATRVAQMWNAYLGTDIITPADMMMMMTIYKQFRFKVTPDYSDNINDVLGYAKIVKTVQEATGGLIDAVTAQEYQAKKAELQVPEATTKRVCNVCGCEWTANVLSCPERNKHKPKARHPYENISDETDGQ